MKQKNKREEKYDWMLSYQWTGIPDEIRQKNLEKILDFFEKNNQKIFCSDQFQNFFDLNNMGSEENYNFCLEAQKRAEKVLFFIFAENESTGMKKELALTKKNKQKAILLLNQKYEDLDWVQEFKDFVEEIIYFDDFEKFDFGELKNFL